MCQNSSKSFRNSFFFSQPQEVDTIMMSSLPTIKLRLREAAVHPCSSAINRRNLNLNPGLSDANDLLLNIPVML